MFTEVIEDLLRSGLSETQIAEKVGATQPSINRIRRGKQKPGYELGAALLLLRNKKKEYGAHWEAA